MIAFFALLEGLQEVVKASIIGSIIGNILLVLGRRDVRRRAGQAGAALPDRTAVGAQSAMLLLAVAALVMPAVFQLVDGGSLPRPGAEDFKFGSTLEHLSLAVAIVLIVSYARRPGVLAADAPRRLQPRARGRGDRGDWSIRQQRDRARDRGRRGRA